MCKTMCNGKRSFDKFAEPPLPFKFGGPWAHINDEDDYPTESSDGEDSDTESSDGESSDGECSDGECSDSISETESDVGPPEYGPKELTIGDLIAAGSDSTKILATISSLTNDIHPIFRDENICACEYTDDIYCLAPHYAAHPEALEGVEKAPEIASPFAKDNILVRAILQLATNFITHDDTLPFWAGIVECGLGPPGKTPFRVHPRKKLSAARKAETLQHLEKFAELVRFHFKVFEECLAGYSSGKRPKEGEPDYDPARDPWAPGGWCKCPVNEYCDCRQGAVYAYRDGKPVVLDDVLFQHVFLNAEWIEGFDQSSEEWRDMTIPEVKKEIFVQAVILCHEFAHALMNHHCEAEVPMNDEPVAETGFCWENFVFGGMVRDTPYDPHLGNSVIRTHVVQWPDLRIFEKYSEGEAAMPIRYFGKLQDQRELPFDASRCTRFLDQSFWDAKKPSKDFKKMWLKPYIEAPMHYGEYHTFNPEAYEKPVEVSAKKRRLSDATMERERLYASRLRRAELILARPGRESRYLEKLEERKEEFHEREKHKLNALWESCTENLEIEIFLKQS